jgi:hypothetical protein
MPFLRRRLAALGLLAVLLTAAAPGLASQPVPVGPGVTHTRIYVPEGPWAIHVLTADLSNQYLEIGSLLGHGAALGRGGVSEMLANGDGAERKAIAGVNADFFALTGRNYATIPLGFCVQDGELITLPNPSRSVFYVTQDGRAGIDVLRSLAWVLGPNNLRYPISAVNRCPEAAQLVLFTPRFGKETRAEPTTAQIVLGDVSGPVKPSGEVTATVSSRATTDSVPIPPNGLVLAANGVASYALRNVKAGDRVTLRFVLSPEVGELRLAVGGGPRLVRDGSVVTEHRLERFADTFATARHPRTGVGLRGTEVVFVTVDGRQPGYSAGMTLPEFARFFVDLGCSDAMNLDGGGSTTMVVRGRIVNSPSDGVERKVADALALFSLAPPVPAGAPPRPAVRLVLDPDEVSVLSGEKLSLKLTGLDEYADPTVISQGAVRWNAPSGLGSIAADGTFTAAAVTSPAAGLVTAQSGEMLASAVVAVVPAPARLILIPDRLTLPPGGKQQFAVRAYDDRDRLLQLPPARLSWSCEPPTASIDALGLLRVPDADGRYRVIASVGEVRAEAEVLVGVVTEMLADFEKGATVTFTSAPAGTPGDAAVVADPTDASNHCVKLSYDFAQAAGTRTAEVALEIPLPEARTISLRVLGDGQGAWLRARVRDGAGTLFPVDLADKVEWPGEWKRVTGWLPEQAVPPLTLESVYVTEFRADRRPAGAIYLDDIGAAALPKTEEPAPAPEMGNGEGTG